MVIFYSFSSSQARNFCRHNYELQVRFLARVAEPPGATGEAPEGPLLAMGGGGSSQHSRQTPATLHVPHDAFYIRRMACIPHNL